MQTRYFALVFGIIYLIAGIAGFIPGLLVQSPGLPPVTVDTLYGRVLGLFPVNILHSIFHLAIGIWGIAVWRNYSGARAYARGLAVVYGVLTIIGLIPATNTLFGLVPLYGHDIWLHALTAIIAAYFGWVVVTEQPAETVTTARR